MAKDMRDRAKVGIILPVQVDVVVLGVPGPDHVVADFFQAAAAARHGVLDAGSSAKAAAGCVADEVSGQGAADEAGSGGKLKQHDDGGL